MRRLLSLLCVLAACSRPGAPEPKTEADPEHDHGDEDHAHEGRLHVDREMLRDLRITTAAVESRPYGEVVTVLGELRVPDDSFAEVGCPIPARIVRVLVAPGDRVQAGQLLAELESAEVGKARAALATAAAKGALARRVVERRRGLAKEQIVAERELEQSEAELIEAEAEERSSRASLSALGGLAGEGASVRLSSPIAGTVITRTAHRGQLVDAEHALFAIGDLAKLWVVVHAFERDALRVRVGGKTRLSLPALPGEGFEAEVLRVGSRVDPTSRTLDVVLGVDNADKRLRPGMSAAAQLPLGATAGSVIAVPVTAVQRLGDGWSVFVPTEEEGAFEVRAVGRGRDLGGEVEILSGLEASERVVVDGAFLLKAEAEKARGGGEHHHH